MEPIATAATLIKNWDLDLALIPLVAIDRHGNRLGMGKGYYDRTFAYRLDKKNSQPFLLGLAYNFQLVENIEPEIIADTPSRLAPGRSLPIMLLIKDADKYPIKLEHVRISESDQQAVLFDEEYNIDVAIDSWHRIIQLDQLPELETLKILVEIRYSIRGQRRTCIQNNLPGIPGEPFTVHQAGKPLPGENVLWGDLHHHTSWTEDMMEFGAPVEASVISANSFGLDFLALTDHSYDLDDEPGSWRTTDGELKKWHASRAKIGALSSRTDGLLLIPGEEVTVTSANHTNVHTLVLNHPEYLPGSGDGGERPLRTRSELTVTQLTARLDPDALAIAAHPYYQVPLLQRLIVRRNSWVQGDILNPRISGIQIMNGALDKGFYRGRDAWIDLLLAGYRKYIYAGTDSHGDFNRFTGVKRPLISLIQRQANFLGCCRTGIVDQPSHSLADTIKALAAGRCQISSGPSIILRAKSGDKIAQMGEELAGDRFVLTVTCSSTPDFGSLDELRIYKGIIGASAEILSEVIDLTTTPYSFVWEKEITAVQPQAYYRAECTSRLPAAARSRHIPIGLALTNPIWVKQEGPTGAGPSPG